MRAATSVFCLAFAAGLSACDEHDLGRTCEPRPATPLPSDPIPTEQPLVEEVSIERATECESFQCLTHGGYPSYCTRACSYDGAPGAECVTNTECNRPEHCYEGRCQDDDCPAGFECRPVQDVGPLAGRLFCVYKEDCGGSNRECEALGEMECRRLGCFDATLESGADSAPHLLTCEDRDALTFCRCPDGGTGCTGEELVCDPGDGVPWPAGSVDVRDVCMRPE